MNNDSSIDNNDLSDEWLDDDDYCETMEGFTDEIEAGKKNWNYYESFDTMDSFRVWKSADKYNWVIGTKANHKINGQYLYTNYKCNSHISCKAQVNEIRLHYLIMIIFVNIIVYLFYC